ncbi:hypothetical protein ACWD6R_21310 [Streptomyces sp. NPDC005151]
MALIAVVTAVVAVVRSRNVARDAHVAWARAELPERQAKAADARTAALADEIRQLARKRMPAAALDVPVPAATSPRTSSAIRPVSTTTRLCVRSLWP